MLRCNTHTVCNIPFCDVIILQKDKRSLCLFVDIDHMLVQSLGICCIKIFRLHFQITAYLGTKSIQRQTGVTRVGVILQQIDNSCLHPLGCRGGKVHAICHSICFLKLQVDSR